MLQQAPVIVSSQSPFATAVFTTRHPALIDRLTRAWPYTPQQHQALAELAQENVNGVMQPLPEGAVGADQWKQWGADYYGRPWVEAPFLWAEAFFYRRLLEAVDYYAPGPWRGVDLFAPFKQSELVGEAVAVEIAALDDLAGLAEQERGQALLLGSLWGNRADLALQITAGRGGRASGLVADDSTVLWDLLHARRGGAVALVADNAGSEMVADLALVDHLLSTGLAGEVVLHVKPTPYYVSDATLTDVADCLRTLLTSKGEGRAVGERLRTAAKAGQWLVRTDDFWCSPFDFTAMPVELRSELAAATVVVFKGDLNYRRLVGDRWWKPTTSFAAATAYFPGRVASLRALKSDVIVGMEPGEVQALEATDEAWRTSGAHGLVQVR
ncbi:uncharacterized protein DUF89 [Streptomyces sp. 846.5]|nr:damage-control phosphatase ARMT1 family protein [Streptomyces sp. 846.5]TDU01857.1 uncharacterized protein DUF89 [Streptomyces sp. 846.5]